MYNDSLSLATMILVQNQRNYLYVPCEWILVLSDHILFTVVKSKILSKTHNLIFVTLEANAKLFNWFYLLVVSGVEWQQTETVRTHALYPGDKEFHFGTAINSRKETSIESTSFLFRAIFNLLESTFYFPLKMHSALVEWSVELSWQALLHLLPIKW